MFGAVASFFDVHLSSLSPLLCVCVIILLACFILSRSPAGKGDNAPPGPWGWPVIGNLPQLGKKPHVTLTQLRKKYGDVYKITLGSRQTVVLNGLYTIKQALVKQAEEFAGRPDFYSFKFIGNGKSMGFGDYGPRWKMHRRLAQNALAGCINKKTNPIEESIVSEAGVLVSNLLASNGAPINPHNEIYLSVGNIICALCFGKRYKRDDPDFLQLIRMNDEFMAFAGAGNPVDIMPWVRFFTFRSFNTFVGILNTMTAFCVKKQKEHLDTYDPAVARDVTDLLIRAVQETPDEEKEAVGLTDEHILTTVQELIGAGFDTIASTLQWSVLFMMAYPDHQDKVYEEISSHVAHTGTLDLEDMNNLPFTEACLLEIMRHSCIFPFALPHSTTKDTSLKNYHIANKTLIFVNMWSVSHDEDLFPDPDRFDPYRFLDDTGRRIDKAKTELFLPFGVGRRRCPGEQLAKMELFLFFATMMLKCKFESPLGDAPVIDSKYGLTLKPVDFEVVVTKRQPKDNN
ncbi:cytochrome P450 1A1-like [Haliotis asinina]|uniref:cytochrome P450 1A1-like n=1 Tax=Haliotis asinina TaxID=109174 RepID=UPI0035325DDA